MYSRYSEGELFKGQGMLLLKIYKNALILLQTSPTLSRGSQGLSFSGSEGALPAQSVGEHCSFPRAPEEYWNGHKSTVILSSKGKIFLSQNVAIFPGTRPF